MTLILGILLGMVLGGSMMALGYGFGYRSRSNMLPPVPRLALEIVPMGDCTCDHAQSFHVGGKGVCRKEWWDKDASDYYQCDCHIYVPKNPPTTPYLEAMREIEGL